MRQTVETKKTTKFVISFENKCLNYILFWEKIMFYIFGCIIKRYTLLFLHTIKKFLDISTIFFFHWPCFFEFIEIQSFQKRSLGQGIWAKNFTNICISFQWKIKAWGVWEWFARYFFWLDKSLFIRVFCEEYPLKVKSFCLLDNLFY